MMKMSEDIKDDIVEDIVEETTEEVVEESVEEVVEETAEKTEVDDMPEERKSGEVNHRSMAIMTDPIDEESRTVKIAVSSEEPVERSFGMEVLSHDEEHIDLSFLRSGRAPLLLDHDPEKVIGVIKNVELDSSTRRLRAEVRFGRGALAREAFDDVLDGIRSNISVGYSINEMKKRDKDTYVATRWSPVEASLVSIPADKSVGVGRSEELKTDIKPTIIKESIMTDQVDVASITADAKKDAQRNASQIVELGMRHNLGDLAHKAIADGKSIEEFRGVVLDKISSSEALESQDVGLSKEEVRNFSFSKAILALANPRDKQAQRNAEFEFECSRMAEEKYGRTAQGIMIPAEVQRTLNSANESALISDDYRGGSFIDVLRNASSVMQAGATVLNGLSGDVVIPKKLTAANASWISTEGGDATESEMTVGSIRLSPKTLGAYTDITRSLLLQDSIDTENLVRDDLIQALGLAMDKACLEGTGANGQPTGILNTTGVNQVANFAAANPTFAEVVGLETAVAEDNALMGNLAYILGAGMYGALKTTEKATGTAQFVADGSVMNGYRSILSNQATAGNLYFGNFSDVLIGLFGGLDLTIDPYTHSKSGTIRVVALQSMDVAIRHAQSFAFGNDGA
jgi:HK97 family phage major capsid protein